MSLRKRSRAGSSIYSYIFLFVACLLGCFLGCITQRCLLHLSSFQSPSFLSAFLTGALFLFTALFLPSFSCGKYFCFLLFFVHGFLSGFFLLTVAASFRLFLRYLFRELFLLSGAFLSFTFSFRSDWTHFLFPVIILTLFSVLGTLLIYI